MRKRTVETIRYLKWRLSPTYRRMLHNLESTDFHPKARWDAWQFTMVKKILVQAFERSPYYRDLFRICHLNPHEMRSMEDFRHYPFLTRKTLQMNSRRLIADGEPLNRLMHAFTGGTTGEPVPIIRYWHDLSREKAVTTYNYRMLGINPYCKKVILRGAAEDDRGCFFYRTEFGRTLRLSSLNLCDRNLSDYVEQIRSFKPLLLWATPSIALVLCQFMERRGITHFRSLKWAYTPSENLYPAQKAYIEKILQCRVCNSYGQSEHVVSAGRCMQSDFYHVLPQYSYAELIGADGMPVTEEGGIGEIVGTAFTNSCYPLIRYRTNDFATFTRERCPCGREFPLWKTINGRSPAIAWSRDLAPVSVGPELLCTVFDEANALIRQFYLEQKIAGALSIHVLPFADQDWPEIVRYFEELFNRLYPRCFTISVCRLEKFTLTDPGKTRYFIQHITCDEKHP